MRRYVHVGPAAADMATVLESELAALHIWQTARNPRGGLALPDEVWDGMTISIDKIETVLLKTRSSNRPRRQADLSSMNWRGRRWKTTQKLTIKL